LALISQRAFAPIRQRAFAPIHQRAFAPIRQRAFARHVAAFPEHPHVRAYPHR